MKTRLIMLLCAATVCYGCKATKTGFQGTVQPPMPPLPPKTVPRAKQLPVEPSWPRTNWIVTWENNPVQFPDFYESFLESSRNLTQWSNVATLPYLTLETICLTNCPADYWFFRAGNRLKP